MIEHIHFVTGKLAEPALRSVVAKLSEDCKFAYSIGRLPISVAALMTSKWVLRHLDVPPEANRVIFPGYLAGSIEEIQDRMDIPVECGPKDLRDLPEYFGRPSLRGEDYGEHSIEILAEINYAKRFSTADLVSEAKRLRDAGADWIDLGCDPSSQWIDIGDAVRRLCDLGIQVSVDTFDANEARWATQAGAKLVLSVNASNRSQSIDWGAEVVVVPDDLEHFADSLSESIDYLEKNGVRYRLDPILEPIGCGFAASLNRYRETRRHFPNAPMMMGIGNVTELTDVDSAGINTILLGFCQELEIQSVLTTQVIPWAQTSVRECNLARKLVHYAVQKRIPPKRIDDQLVMLRDPKRRTLPPEQIANLAESVKDNNYRILNDGVRLHLISKGIHIIGNDPFAMIGELLTKPESENVDPGHAFYLGFELSKALTAMQLGKNYEQDQSLRWGHLTQEESHHRLEKRKRKP